MKVLAVKLSGPEDVEKLHELLEQATRPSRSIREYAAEDPYAEATIMDAVMSGFETAARVHEEYGSPDATTATFIDQLPKLESARQAAFLVGTMLFVAAIKDAERAEASAKADEQEYRIVEDVVACQCGSNCGKVLEVKELPGFGAALEIRRGKTGAVIVLDRAGVERTVEQLLNTQGGQR